MILDFSNFPVVKGDRVAFADYFEGCLKCGTVIGFDENDIIVNHINEGTYRLRREDVIVIDISMREKEKEGHNDDVY